MTLQQGTRCGSKTHEERGHEPPAPFALTTNLFVLDPAQAHIRVQPHLPAFLKLGVAAIVPLHLVTVEEQNVRGEITPTPLFPLYQVGKIISDPHYFLVSVFVIAVPQGVAPDFVAR